MRRALTLLSIVFGFIAVADGIAMMLPGPSSTAGGACLVALGSAWLLHGLPRVVRAEARPFTIGALAQLGVVLVPPLSVAVAGLWWVSTPEALNWWFAAAWALVWLGCAGALLCAQDSTIGRGGSP